MKAIRLEVITNDKIYKNLTVDEYIILKSKHKFTKNIFLK